MNYNLGLCSISFRKNTPEEILETMKAAGLSVIEWGSDVHCPPEKAAELAALQARYGIACSSYGTYFCLGTTPVRDLSGYIAAAKTLGTDILRLWCGDKNSGEYTETEKAALFADCKAAAEMAEQNGVVLCMECHNNTYTNTKESALELMQAVNSQHFQMYWQPNQYRTYEENVASATLLAPYTRHLHVFNWNGNARYPLLGAKEIWREYLACFAGPRTLLLEFMPDDKIETLKTEAEALKEIVE